MDASIVTSTWRALLEPRRLAPIACVVVPLLYAQRVYSVGLAAFWVGLAMCVAFVLVAPVSYRAIVSDHVGLVEGAARLATFAGVGAFTVGAFGVIVPRALGVRATFMTARSALAIDVALFLAGGWGLGRDIAMEASLARERKRAEDLAREAERAQLLALKANLDPHFLFNTLNAIAEWCRTDGVAAERAVLQLSALLRAVLEGIDAPSWPLARELDVCKSLLSLHRMRDPDRFTLAWDVDARAESASVPPMLLFALVENAITHGPAKGHRGEVRVRAARKGERVVVEISNPGRYGGPRPGSRGVPTVARRLALAYDDCASVAVVGEGERTIATVDFPARASEAA
jgi:signal transduction histidine kinase